MGNKLTIKISQLINAKMKALDEAIKEKYNNGKEFYGILIAPKDDVWFCEDMIVPKQKVSGSSVDIPKEGKYAPYQIQFEKYLKESKTHVIIGTIHSHNGMGDFFSNADDDDLDNDASFNLMEGLPFIDIVWSGDDFKARVKLKIGKGKTKQIFTHEECEMELIPDEETKTILEKIKKLVSSKYKIDEDTIKNSIVPNIDVQETLKNIELEKSSFQSNQGYYGNQFESKNSSFSNISPFSEVRGGDVSIEIKPYDKKENMLTFSCKGEVEAEKTEFVDIVDENIRPEFESTGYSYLDEEIKVEIPCPSKKKYKKLSNKIHKIHVMFLKEGQKDKLEKKVNTVKTDDSDQDLRSFNDNEYPSYFG